MAHAWMAAVDPSLITEPSGKGDEAALWCADENPLTDELRDLSEDTAE